MSTIAKRVDKVEAAMKARAGDLSLLSAEELERRVRELITRFTDSRERTIDEWSAMPPAEITRCQTRLGLLASRLADKDLGLVAVSELIECAKQKQDERHATT